MENLRNGRQQILKIRKQRKLTLGLKVSVTATCLVGIPGGQGLMKSSFILTFCSGFAAAILRQVETTE